MGDHELGRVLDPDALATSTGPRARLRIEVPARWLVEGADIVVRVPSRLVCARCQGGGCDGCNKSGGLRVPEDANRSLRVRLPEGQGNPAVLRLVRPFGDETIEQLFLEVVPSAEPAEGVSRVPRPRAPKAPPAPFIGFVFLAAGFAAALVFVLSRC